MSVACEVMPKPNPGDVVDRVLEDIEKRYGEVSNEVLEREAADLEHPLHSWFEWDDSIAGRKYRLEQAARIIRASKFISYRLKGEPAVPLRRYISFPTNEGRYVSRAVAMKTLDVRQAFIGHKISVLQGWCNEASDVPELAELRALILKGLARFSA